ncbi:MAG: LamG domain-containing protein [Proteobacteria bacterium]|nr:MAG: LamG domain-containing protein [Pseudomonadota bacterium]
MSPGTLGIAASLVLEQGANFADTTVGSEIALAGDVTIQGTSAGLIIRPTEAVSLKKPLTISMPLPSGTGLHLAESNHYLIFYKSFDPVSGELLTGTKAVDGVSAKLVFDTSTNRDSVSFEGYFGAYWVAKVSREVKKEELAPAKLSTEPVININRVAVIDQKGIVSEAAVVAAQAVPDVIWGAIQTSFQSSSRSLKVNASIASGRVLSLCKLDISEDKTLSKFSSTDSGSALNADYPISKRSAHDLYARFRCNDDLGRFTVSPWSSANAIPAATPSAPKDVAFSGSANAALSAAVNWSNDLTIGFAEHRVKLCASSNCSTGCSEEVSAASSPVSLNGIAGASLFACVKSLETSGLISAWTSSANPLNFPGSSSTTGSSAPTIIQVTSNLAAGNYSVSMVIPILVTFSEPVLVSGGDPRIALAVTPSATAIYSSGSGTSTLTFNYTIAAGQSAARLDYQNSNSLSLNGAAIKSGAGLNADLTLPIIGAPNSLGMLTNLAIVIPNNQPVLMSNYGNFNIVAGGSMPNLDINDVNSGSDMDVDGDALSYSCTFSMTSNSSTYYSGASCSLLGGIYSLGSTTGLFSWSPNAASVPLAGKPADYVITIAANDGRGGVASTSLTAKVIAPNNIHYAFNAGQGSSYDYDPNLIDYSGGYARLIAADQLDNDSSSSGFASGEANGISFMPNGIRLGASALCNGLIANCNKLPSLSAELASFRDYYPMDGNTFSANGFTTVSGATMINDSKVGSRALELNGSTNYATIPGNLSGDFTVSFWLRAINGYTDCSDFANGVGLVSGRSASLTNHWGISICDGWIVAGSNLSIKSNIQINNNTWRLITFSRSASTGIMRLYIDGRINASLAGTTNSLTNSPVLNIGSHPGVATYYQGQIDELAIYQTVLSDASIQYQYDMQKTERSGYFVSQVMDSKAPGAIWQSLDWKTALPNGKQLPDYNLAIVNESPADYSGLPTPSLMNGNIGLWHLNESSVGTAPGGKDFMDNSGNLAHAQLYGNTNYVTDRGRFRSSVRMTAGSYAKMQSAAFELGTGSLTVSAWVKYTDNSDAKIFGTGWITPSTGWSLNASQGKLMFSIGSVSATAVTSSAIQTNNNYNDDVWHHVLGVLDRSLNIASCTALNANSGQPAYLGGTTTVSFNGAIDEVALWSRALLDSEIKSVYLRGGNRVKFQVKSCSTANCIDGVLLGPEGNDTSYYTEILNSTNPTNPLGLAKPTSPNLEFGTVGLNVPTGNRYFQYKVILESDDRNDLCNYGSNASCSPELQSVHVGPDHYPEMATIRSLTTIPFYSFQSLADTFGPAGCPHGTRYVLSRDGINWFAYPSSNWQAWAGNFAGATSVSGINAGAGLFGTQVGRDNFFIKAVLGSNGLTPCELDDVSLQFNSSF